MSRDQFLKTLNQPFPISNDLSTPPLILEKQGQNIISQKVGFSWGGAANGVLNKLRIYFLETNEKTVA
jgi:hypothetical protein